MATGASTAAAGRRVHLGAQLASRFPTVLERMADGELPVAAAAKVAAVCEALDDAACAEVDRLIAPRLAAIEPSRVGSETRRVAHRVAAEQLAEAARRNRAQRDVDVSPGPDGTAIWWAQLPSETSAAMWSAIAELAARYRSDEPALTAGQARADALTDLVLHRATVATSVTLGVPVLTTVHGDGDRDGGRHGPMPFFPPLRVPDEHLGEPGWAEGPVSMAQAVVNGAPLAVSGVELPKVGFVPPDIVAILLSSTDVTMSRALLDADTGVLLETTSAAYRTPEAMRHFVTVRDGTCRMFGCTRAAVHVDVDHATPWPEGPTTPTNLAGLCRRHHRTKQHERWRYELAPDGACTWVSPSGQRRTTYPPLLRLPAIQTRAAESVPRPGAEPGPHSDGAKPDPYPDPPPF